MEIRIFSEQEVRQAVSLSDAISTIESAFVSYSEKSATVPPVVHLQVPEHHGEVHVKSAYIHRTSECVIKVATGFYRNRLRNLPSGSGLMLILSAETGFPLAILLDHGYLTDLRTAAAGAVAAKHMANEEVEQVAILGAGIQGRFQLEALACVRRFKRVMVYDHHVINIAAYIAEMEHRIDSEIFPASTVEEATRGSRIVVTCTPSRKPFVTAAMIEPGTHITAMGADGPEKQELDPEVIVKADCVVADSVAQCVQFGELQHAIRAGLIEETDIDGELGDVIRRRIPGRTDKDQITLCDLTGVGVQDAAIAQLAFQRASSLHKKKQA
jgi:ectoine utilization protein EutC